MKRNIRMLSAVMAAVLTMGSMAGCAGSGGNAGTAASDGAVAKTAQASKAEAGDPASGKTESGSPAVAGGQSAAEAADPNRSVKDNMVIALIEEPQAITPAISSISANSHVSRQIHDTLVVRNEQTDEYSPCLADTWEQKDELTWIFHIRDDVYFHNGDKLTPEDIVYNFERIATLPATKSRWTSLDYENCKVLDDGSVEMKLSSPWGKVLMYLSTLQIVSQKVDQDPNSNIERNPVGTGPYKFVSWATGDSIVLERNDDYWGDKAITKTLTFKFFPDSSIRAIQLEAGDADFFFTVGSADYDRLMGNPDVQIYAETGTTHESIYFCQSADSVYQDVNVRKALTYALDVPAAAYAVWGDLAMPGDSIYSSSIEGHVSIGPVKQDIELAKKCLADAGYPDGLTCEMTVPNDSNTLAYLEIFQAMWAEAGINMTVNSYDSATVKQMNASGKNPMGRSSFTSNGDPVNALAAWEIGYSGVMQPQDKHIDELIKKTRASSDKEERAGYLAEIQHYALEEKYYAIPVAFVKQSYAMSKDVFGFVFSPSEQIYFSQMGVYEN